MDIKSAKIASGGVATLSPPSDNMVLVNSLIQRVQPYYRSKAFVSQIGINSLIAAAAPVFFLIEKFQQANIVSDLETLRDDLLHEIKAFENHAQTRAYKSQTILIARYILSLWVDEMILNTAWGKNGGWKNLLLSTDNKRSASEKSFFALLEHCLQDTPTHIDLLELFYLCLSLGFEGEYKHMERSHLLLSELRDNLYHRIQHQRGEISKQLEITMQQEKTSSQKRSLKPILAASSSFILLVAVIGGYFFMNNQLWDTFNHTYSAIQKLTIKSLNG